MLVGPPAQQHHLDAFPALAAGLRAFLPEPVEILRLERGENVPIPFAARLHRCEDGTDRTNQEQIQLAVGSSAHLLHQRFEGAGIDVEQNAGGLGGLADEQQAVVLQHLLGQPHHQVGFPGTRFTDQHRPLRLTVGIRSHALEHGCQPPKRSLVDQTVVCEGLEGGVDPGAAEGIGGGGQASGEPIPLQMAVEEVGEAGVVGRLVGGVPTEGLASHPELVAKAARE